MSFPKPSVSGLTGNHQTYAIAVVIPAEIPIDSLEDQIRAVLKNNNAITLGDLLLTETAIGTAIIFHRDTPADMELISAPITRAKAVTLLAGVFEPVSAQSPGLQSIYRALMDQRDYFPKGRARDEGWALKDATPGGLMLIQRSEGIISFSSHENAFSYVKCRAAQGSLRHLEAWAIHIFDAEIILNLAEIHDMNMPITKDFAN